MTFRHHWALCLLLTIAGTSVTAQDFLDPRDGVYSQLEEWQARGWIDHLPAYRPYGVQVLLGLLQQVTEAPEANPSARELAQVWQARLRGSVISRFEDISRTKDDQVGNLMHVQSRASALVDPQMGLLFRFDGNTVHLPSKSLTLPGTGVTNDFIQDWSDVSLFGLPWQVYELPQGDVMLGALDGKGLYAQLGISRQSIGPIGDDGVIVSPGSPATGHIGLGYLGQGWEYSQALISLRSSNNDGSLGSMDKYLYYHGLTVLPWPGVEATFFEVVIGGGQLQPLYFVPLSLYFASQGFGGFSDNSFLGASAAWRFAPGWKVAGVVNLDDLHFNDLFRLKLNTKYKLAAQASLLWAGTGTEPFWVPSVTMDYTAITPYTYTHINTRGATSPNYEMYTTGVSAVGSDLLPNSDRWRVKARWQNLTAFAALLRHGNASAGIIPGADGSYTDPGYLNGEATFQAPFVDPTGQPQTRFLTQAVLETRAQTGFRWEAEAPWSAETGAFGWTAAIGLSGEVVWNEGFVTGTSTTHLYTDVSFGLRW